MGEYIKYREKEIKIGTCENLYYVNYPKYCDALKNNFLFKVEGNAVPEEYAKPDTGFRFRFPFPDEDHLPFGQIPHNDHSRGLPVTIDTAVMAAPYANEKNASIFQIEIVQQKLVHRESDNKLCLALVCRDPTEKISYRIEDDDSIKDILSQILKHHVQNETNQEKKSFYRTVALRILKGYRLSIQSQSIERKPRQSPQQIHPSNNQTKKLGRS